MLNVQPDGLHYGSFAGMIAPICLESALVNPGNREFMRKSSLITVCLCTLTLLSSVLAGCSNGSSDALNVMQSNADGTIAALNSDLSTAQATLTAVGTLATQLALVQADQGTLQAEYVQAVSQLNGSGTTPVSSGSQATPPAGGQSQPPATNAAGSTPVGTPNGFILDTPVTTKSLDANGCALSPATTFSTTDLRINVVAKAHNLKKGEVFTASWAGTITHQDTWTANFSATVTCIHFYVEPKTLNMGAGDWTVTLSAADAPGGSATFTLQGVQPAATSQVGQ
jgi:hypothetical protein